MNADIEMRRYAYFRTREVKRKLVKLISECFTETEAAEKIKEAYPYISSIDALALAENFKDKLSKL